MNPLAAQTPRTLIADDQPDVLAALRLLLKGAGYQTEAATSPAAVLDAIKRNNFDAVLMDLNYARDTTSGQEGLDLISSIRALDSVVPIIVMTAWGSVDLAVETMRRGVRDFVQKPWDNSRLLHTLGTQIELGRVKRRQHRRNAENRINNRRLRVEFEEALEIQRGLLPKTMPSIPGFELTSAWQPANTVSGDYVSAFNLNEDLTALCVADVAGKGLPAALLMANMQAALKSAASETTEPHEVCSSVNDLMSGNMPENKFITCFYAVLDRRRKTLKFTNAGHNPPLLVRRNGECISLVEGGHVIGVFPDAVYTHGEIELCSGDRLLMFTDGLTEAANAAGGEFGDERLIELLVRERSLSATHLQEKILRAVSEFNDGEITDDATCLLLAVQ